MKKTVPVICIICGLLFILIPRYILPVCEYEGYSPMHCSDTARAEYVLGGLLLLLGSTGLFIKLKNRDVFWGISAIVLFSIAIWLPEQFGYCRSERMPCNFGTVRGIRFVAVCGIIAVIISLMNHSMRIRKQGKT